MRKRGNEFKVGLFVLIALAGLFYITVKTGKFGLKKDGYVIYAVFDKVGGLEEKAPVMLNGLEVGKVESIKFDYSNNQTKIILSLWLDKKAKVRKSPRISIKTLGLMGEKYIDIYSPQGNSFLKPGAKVEGKSPLDIDDLMDQVNYISGYITPLLKETTKLVKTINSSVAGNKERIDEIIKNLELSSKNFEEFSADIKRHPWKLLFKTKERKKRKPRRKK